MWKCSPDRQHETKELVIKRVVFIFLFISALSNAQIDSLEGILSSLSGTERINVLNDLCYLYAFSDPDKALEYGNEAIELVENESAELRARVYNDVSLAYYGKSDYQGMIELNRQSLALRTQINDSLGQAANLMKIGLAFEELGMLDSALYYDKKAINIYEAIGNDLYRISVLNNVSLIHERLGNLKEALQIHAEIQKLSLVLGDQFTYYKSLGNEANVHTKLKNFQLAEQKLAKCEEYFQNEKLFEHLANSYLGRGVNFKYMGDTTRAIEFYYLAHQTYSNNGIPASQPLINLGNTYLETGQLDSASKFLEMGLEIALQTKSYKQLRHSYHALSQLEEKRGNFQQSLDYLKLKEAYDDSIFTESIADRVSEYEVAYQTEKQEKLRLEEEQKRTQAEILVSNRNKWIFGISGALLTVIFLALMIVQMRARKAKAEKDAAILEERERGLEAVFEAAEEERQRIAKDLHDGIGQQMSGLKMAWSNLTVKISSELGDEAKQLEELTAILNDAASEVREISHQMMPKALEESGLVDALKEMLDKSLRLTGIKHEFEHFNFEGRLEPKIELSLYRVSQELINNVIKHSGADFVSVQLFLNGDYLILIIEDNGRGMEASSATDGHGMLNIKSRLNTIDGNVNYEASPNAGTTATIRIKLT